jgi:uncharacterized protein (DUF58 family)
VRQGRLGLIGLLGTLREQPAATDGRVGATSLDAAIRTADALARQRSLVVLVSDFRGPMDWRKAMLQLAGRHDVIAVEIRDPREQELPKAGELWLVDPETGRLLRVDTRSDKLRRRFAEAAAAERRGLAQMFTKVGVRHVVLTTSGDWLRQLAVFLRKTRPR